MLRNWVAKINKLLTKRASSRRKELPVPIILSLEPDKNVSGRVMPQSNLSITGETQDFSRTGIAFVVPCIRLREFYLVGENRVLNAEITLPNATVRMRVMGLRYEQTGEHLSVTQYLVGAKIVEMAERDRGLYEEFLSGNKASIGAFKLEIEKS